MPLFAPPARPSFHHARTSDRLREGTGLLIRAAAAAAAASSIRKGRKSVFREVGIESSLSSSHPSLPSEAPPALPPQAPALDQIIMPSPDQELESDDGESACRRAESAGSVGSSCDSGTGAEGSPRPGPTAATEY